jgi:hydroxysqualene dehydroxylase
MTDGTVHVVGAGLAGLAAAVTLAERGAKVVLCEALAQAGGRARSYRDGALDLTIDNGSHLVLSGNTAVQSYVQKIGAADALTGPANAEFSFADLASGARWSLRPNDGALPWWLFAPSRRVPGTVPKDYIAYGGLLRAKPSQTIGEVAPCHGPLWDRLMRPLLLAVLNTEPEQASAKLAAAVLRETLLKGGRSYAPRIATPNLAAAFVDPALRHLEANRAEIRFRRKLRRIVLEDGRAGALEFDGGAETLGPADALVLAAPAWFARELLPGISTPTEFRPIVNLHFKAASPAGAPRILGVIGGTAEWIFAFEDRIAVTISAAVEAANENREALAARVWADVARGLGLPPAAPPFAVVRERLATFAATPAEDAKRPGAATAWNNIFLAGDWTDTGLPSTIEGALRSGFRAADLAFSRRAI